MDELQKLYNRYLSEKLVLAVASNRVKKSESTKYSDGVSKVRFRPIMLRGEYCIQATRTVGTKELHENMSTVEAAELLASLTGSCFRQIEISAEDGKLTVLAGKKGKLTIKQHPAGKRDSNADNSENRTTDIDSRNILRAEAVTAASGDNSGKLTITAGTDNDAEPATPTNANNSTKSADRTGMGNRTGAHNKIKNYCLPEGEPVPFLVELGVMNASGKVLAAKYDKFRQINRYLEFVEDIVPSLPQNREISIIDFGCGKSYLTFALYYYLHEKLRLPVSITGLDLKKDVIEHCNALAEQFGYDRLRFLHGDIADYSGTDSVDMVVTLHACDTATDYALEKAVKWGASVIFCVPCCQHELNRQIKCDELAPVLKYGLLKERIAALVTDGLRAEMLEEAGYRTQILEFIDMEHTPKNILIRAVRQPLKIRKKTGFRKTAEFLNVEPTLDKLLNAGQRQKTEGETN